MKNRFFDLMGRKFLTLGDYEKDTAFCDELQSFAHQGMFTAGLLGSTSLVLFVMSHVFILGKSVVWTYSGIDPASELMLLDKLIMMVFCLFCIIGAKRALPLSWCRWLIFFVVWLVSLTILLDDIAARDISFSTGYITFALIIAVGTMPFRGWQTALISLAIIATTMVAISVTRALFGLSAVNPEPEQIIYLILTTILLTGMSSLIYLIRHKQHVALQRAKELSHQLEERAVVLARLKEKSDQQAERILQIERVKDRFFTNISHEFRTPLTLILGPLKDVLKFENNGKTKRVKSDLLELMYKNGSQLLDLINQLLDLSRIDAGEIQLVSRRVNVSQLVSKVVLSFAALAERNGVELNCVLEEDREMIVMADEKQLERAIGNLISNAVKFTPNGGTVNISVKSTGRPIGKVQIAVEDSGIGIPESDIPYIFDRFYQAKKTSELFHNGTGIGLSLVKEIVELHGGTIEAISEPGSGAKFTVSLDEFPQDSIPDGFEYESPKENGEEFEHPVVEIEPFDIMNPIAVPVVGDIPTVVLIDDNPDILAYLSSPLSTRYHVISCGSSRVALEYIRGNKVDLIISDVIMPEPDGFELCRIIKQDSSLNDIPVILITARVEEESQIEGLEIGADDFISKPFSATEILIRAENLIELRKLLREKYRGEIYFSGKNIDVSSADARLLQQVQAVIDECMGNSNFGVEWLADRVNLSSRQLQRKIRTNTGLSAAGYIRLLRLERASQLLIQRWGNVSEISYKVGFQDPHHFARLFKQTFGVAPSEYFESKNTFV